MYHFACLCDDGKLYIIFNQVEELIADVSQ